MSAARNDKAPDDVLERARRSRAVLLQRQAALRADDESRAEEIRQQAATVAQRLRDRGAERVWLFGSLSGGQVHAQSDLDVAVRGLSPQAFDQAHTELYSEFPNLDLVRWEDAPSPLRDLITTYGRVLDFTG